MSDNPAETTPQIDAITLEFIRVVYPNASWAVWSDEFPDDGCSEYLAGVQSEGETLVEMIREQRARGNLRPHAVLLGHNASRKQPADYWNFHSTDGRHQNHFLRDVVENAGLTGAYMTDLVERITEAKAEKVPVRHRDIARFLTELHLLDQPVYHIVCFGQKVFDAIEEHLIDGATYLGKRVDVAESSSKNAMYPRVHRLDVSWNGRSLQFYGVHFFNLTGFHHDLIPEFKSQMERVADTIATS